MPHQFQSINCKKCEEHYCPVCEDKCPKCSEVDIADDKTMLIRKQMKDHIDRNVKE